MGMIQIDEDEFRRLLNDKKTLSETLTAAVERGSELRDEVIALKARVKALEATKATILEDAYVAVTGCLPYVASELACCE